MHQYDTILLPDSAISLYCAFHICLGGSAPSYIITTAVPSLFIDHSYLQDEFDIPILEFESKHNLKVI